MVTSVSNFRGRRRCLVKGAPPERNTLILGGDEYTLHVIISTVELEGENMEIRQKPESYSEMPPQMLINNSPPEKDNAFSP